MGGGEVEARDLAASEAQHADELTLVGDPGAQTTDGVGVEVAGHGDLPPRSAAVFLQNRNRKS